MFAPVGPLKDAVSKVKGEVHTAEDLAHQATRSPEQAERDGDEVPEDMDAEEAEHVLEEEYRPLMADDDDGEDGPASRKRRGSNGKDVEGGTFKTRALEVYLTKGAFFVSPENLSSRFPFDAEFRLVPARTDPWSLYPPRLEHRDRSRKLLLFTARRVAIRIQLRELCRPHVHYRQPAVPRPRERNSTRSKYRCFSSLPSTLRT